MTQFPRLLEMAWWVLPSYLTGRRLQDGRHLGWSVASWTCVLDKSSVNPKDFSLIQEWACCHRPPDRDDLRTKKDEAQTLYVQPHPQDKGPSAGRTCRISPLLEEHWAIPIHCRHPFTLIEDIVLPQQGYLEAIHFRSRIRTT